MGAPEDESLDVGIEFIQVSSEYFLDNRSFKNPCFYKGDEFGSCDFLDMNCIIDDMDSLLVGTVPYGGFCCENPYFSVRRFYDAFRSRNGNTENLAIGKTNLLKVSDGMGSGGIAGKYDDLCPLIEEEFHPFFRVLSYRHIIESTIRTPDIVAEVEVVVLREDFPKLLENREPANPGIKESNHRERFVRKKYGRGKLWFLSFRP